MSQVRLVKTNPMIMASKCFNKLPLEITLLSDKGFKIKFSRFLNFKSLKTFTS